MLKLVAADEGAGGRRSNDRTQPGTHAGGGRQGQSRERAAPPPLPAGAAFWGDYDPVAAASQAAGGRRSNVAQQQQQQRREGRGTAGGATSAALNDLELARTVQSVRGWDSSGSDRAGRQPAGAGRGLQSANAVQTDGPGLPSAPEIAQGGSSKRAKQRSRSQSTTADAGALHMDQLAWIAVSPRTRSSASLEVTAHEFAPTADALLLPASS